MASYGTAALSSPVSDAVTTISVMNPINVPPPPFMAFVGSEWINVTAVNGVFWSVSRGVNSSTAAPHSVSEVLFVPISAAQGSGVWRVGSGSPSNSVGSDGDLYLKSSTSDVFFRLAGAYSIVANIKGGVGAAGSTGPAGSTGATGPAGPAGASGSSGEIPYVTPVLSDFTWANQGSATVTDTGNGLLLNTPANVAISPNLLEVATGAAPWHVVAKVVPQMLSANNKCGLHWRSSGVNKEVLVTFQNTAYQGYYISTYVNYDGSPFNPPALNVSQCHWLKLDDDGTTRHCYMSATGEAWTLIYSEVSANYMGAVADRVGFHVDSQDAGHGCIGKLLSWQFTSGSI